MAVSDSVGLKPFRAGLGFSFFNAITWQVALGTPMVLFAQNLGASTLVVGVVYSFVFLLAPLELVGALLLPRFGYKGMLAGCWLARSLFLVPLVWLAWKAPGLEDGTWAVPVFMACLFLFCFFRAIGNCCFAPWLYSILPEGSRGNFFGTMQFLVGISSVLALLGCSALFRYLDTFAALQWEFLMAIVGSVAAVICVSRLPEGRRPEPMGLRETTRAGREYLMRPNSFRYFLGVNVALAICGSSLPPFVAYYLKTERGMPESEILLLASLQSLGVMGAAYLVKKTIDVAGPRSIFLISLSLHSLVAVLWTLVLHGALDGFWAYAVGYVGVGWASCLWFTANLNYLPNILDEKRRPLMLAVNSCVVSIVSGVAPIAWGFALKDETELGLPAISHGWFTVYLTGLLVIAIALIALVMRIRIPKYHDEGDWNFGAEIMRPFRAVASFNWLVSKPK